jgi:hypothetical protein
MTLIAKAVRPVQRFVGRMPVERRLLVWSFLLLLAITVGLRLIPLISLQRVIRRVARKGRARSDERLSADTVIWAVTVMSSYAPRATCLVRALVLQTLLEAYGWPSRLRLGLGRGVDGTLAGHAWVEGPDGRVMGDDTRIPYIPLPLFEEVSAR